MTALEARVRLERAFWTLAGALNERWEPRPGSGYDRRWLEWNSRVRQGRPLDLLHPRTTVDKYSWLRLHHRSPLLPIVSDKVRVRRYVALRGLGSLLLPGVRVYRRPTDIEWSELPERFVAKPNHGSHMVLFCKDRKAFDLKAAERRLGRWLRRNYSLRYAETNYRGIPRRIVVEPLLGLQEPFVEYKIHCACGVPFRVVTVLDRANGVLTLGRNDLDWNRLPKTNTSRKTIEVEAPRPADLDWLLHCATVLSQDLLRCRVDLVRADGRLLFGELTIFHEGGHVPRATEEWDLQEAAYIDLERSDEFVERGRRAVAQLEQSAECEDGSEEPSGSH
ncbi:MAG: hypothetical protein N2109_13395 [Fimbriimonadales bacterium]|nr:hypothetical protein [Fimbriimonadales bacterium]